MSNQGILMVYTTFPDEQSAKRIATELVKLKLVACANIFGTMTSIYEWQGEVREEGEVGVLFKTVRSRFVVLSRELCARHPYETPAVVALDAAHVEENFQSWIETQTSSAG